MSNTPGVYGIDDVVSAYYAQGQDKNGDNETENDDDNNNNNETNDSSIPEPADEHQFIQSYNDNEELKAGWKTLPYYLNLIQKQSPLYENYQYPTFIDSDIEKAYEAYEAGIPIIINSSSEKLMVKGFTRYMFEGEEYYNYYLVAESLTYIDDNIYSGPSTKRFDIEVSYDTSHNDWFVNIFQENSYATNIISLTEAEYLDRVDNALVDPHTLYCIIEEENSSSGDDEGASGGASNA